MLTTAIPVASDLRSAETTPVDESIVMKSNSGTAEDTCVIVNERESRSGSVNDEATLITKGAESSTTVVAAIEVDVGVSLTLRT